MNENNAEMERQGCNYYGAAYRTAHCHSAYCEYGMHGK